MTVSCLNPLEDGSVSVSGVSLDRETLSLLVNESAKLTAAVNPADASDKAVKWTSSDEKVAVVEVDGRVTGVAPGKATITVTTNDGGKTDACAVTVTSSVSVSGISLSPAALTLGVNQDLTLTAAVEPKDATNKALIWVSNNESVATVDANGKVTGVAVGTAIITVTTVDGGKNADCAVTIQTDKVVIAVDGVSLPETLTLSVGASETLTAAVTPPEAENTDVTWASDKPGVAAVDGNGVVTGVAVGTANITVTTVDGGKTAKCAVTVQQEAAVIPVTGVSLSPKSLNLGVGQEQTLTAAISPAGAANKAVTWTSSDPNVAAVDNNGKVSALAEGQATITVTTADGGHKDTCAVTVSGVSLSPKTLFLAAGTTGVLKAAVTPPQAVTWASSDTSVAAVDENGKVTGVAPGTATVTVTTEDGSRTDTCAVAVNRFTITNTGEWNSAIEAVKDGGDNQSYTFVINGTVSVPGTEGSAFGGGTDISMTVKGSGELALTSQGSIFSLGAGQTLILGETGGSGPTLRGINGNNTLMVKVDNGGTFTMNSGTITGNHSARSGGGVYVNGGEFAMSGGTIEGNTGSYMSGGVSVWGDGKFAMSGGTIKDNSSDEGFGGGVSVWDGEFTMSGGTISGNQSGARSSSIGSGGGVYVAGEFTMTGGTITGNTAGGYEFQVGCGGGVYVGGEFTMTGGTISGNQGGASISQWGSGGGVYVDGTFTKSGGSISKNRSKEDNGTQVYYNGTPPKYRNSGLGGSDNISTADLETNWDN